jgi:chromate transporter
VNAVPFGEALRFWLKLGFISFGGPAGQIAIMHRVLVEEKRWISEGRFLHALNYCMLLPGPEAQQLATYIGWLMHRTSGGLAAGVLFVLPSLLLLIVLSALYVAYGNTAALQALLYGVKPAVVVLVLAAARRLGKATLKSAWLAALAVASFAAVALQAPFPAVIAVAALCGVAAQRLGLRGFAAGPLAAPHTGNGSKPHADGIYAIDDDTPSPVHARASLAGTLAVVALGCMLAAAAWAALHLAFGAGTLGDMAAFFTKAALVTFGGAYAVLPYVTQAAVEQYHWLTVPQMMDGLALGETTPGPLIMVVAFVGYLGAVAHAVTPDPLASGMLGACVATFFTFLPSFIFIFAGAPWIEHTRARPALHAPLRAISAAVVGVILSLAAYFASHVFWVAGRLDAAALAIAACAAVMQFRLGWGVFRLVPVSAALGACYILATRQLPH